jgi:hypothetical protein
MTITGAEKERWNGRTVIEVAAEQDGNQIIRNAEAELEEASYLEVVVRP